MNAFYLTQEVDNEQHTAYQNFHDLHYDSTGVICISQILEGEWKNKYGRYKAMTNYLESLESKDNIFFSQNTFKKFKRSTEHLFELKALYIDLDYHKKTNYSREQILGSLDILISDGKIPPPTHVIDSGYGLNLIWRIKRVPAQALPLWQTIEEYFFNLLSDFGADRKAMDATRVFRAEGTLNAKYPQKKEVNILYSTGIEYDIHLIQEYVTFDKPKTRKKSQRQSRTVVRLYNRYSLYYSRYIDILAICKLREYDVTGHREQLLFLYRYYGCIFLSDNELALSNALDLNSKFTEPLPEQVVIRATKSAEKAAKDLKYGYRNQTLVNMLDITDEEMARQNAEGEYYLKSIISKEEKYRRNNVRRYNERRDELGLTNEQKRQLELMEQIENLREQGMKQKAIASELGLTIRTVQKYEKKIRESKDKFELVP